MKTRYNLILLIFICMEYKTLDKLQNTYPTTSNNVTNHYTNPNGIITYTGIYSQNIKKFNNTDVSLLNTVNDDIISFRFIVKFINENNTIEFWTSKKFKEDLESAIVENNPYFTTNLVSIIDINFGELENYNTIKKLIEGENDANVTISKTISTKEDILKHIQWMINSETELRPIEDFSEWNLNIIKNSTEEIHIIIPDVVDEDAPPFSVPGRFKSEIRRDKKPTQGLYIWNSDEWEIRK